MVPGVFTGYFAAAAGGAGVLIGLLFVAISLRPETVFGDNAAPGGRALAGSAFTGLANAFFVALTALIPRINLGVTAVLMALISVYSIIKLHRGLRGRDSQRVAMAFSLAVYLGQLAVAVALIARPRDHIFVYDLAYLLVGSLAAALTRAWALLQGKHTAASLDGGPV